jgi:hypothetical protein
MYSGKDLLPQSFEVTRNLRINDIVLCTWKMRTNFGNEFHIPKQEEKNVHINMCATPSWASG